MSTHLVALYKQLEVCLVGVGKTWSHFFAKCVLKVTWPESIHTCKYDQICSGLKARIYGAVHGVKYIWDANSTEENWDFVTVNTKIDFNGINKIRMLWTVHYLWSSGSCFVFKCYHHHSSLDPRYGDGTANILHITEAVTQGGAHWILLTTGL